MIAPIHAIAGATISRVARPRGRVLYCAALLPSLVSHQAIDWCNLSLQHYLPYNLDLYIGALGLFAVFYVVLRMWRGHPRKWDWPSAAHMIMAMMPDIIDWGILKPLGHNPVMHHWLWSEVWSMPIWAAGWLVTAIVFGVVLLYRRKKK